jgi:hypothetical protein
MFVEKMWLFMAIFLSENFEFREVRFYNCFICDLNCTIFVLYGCRVMFQLYVNHALNYPWFRVSAHVTKVALIFARG